MNCESGDFNNSRTTIITEQKGRPFTRQYQLESVQVIALKGSKESSRSPLSEIGTPQQSLKLHNFKKTPGNCMAFGYESDDSSLSSNASGSNSNKSSGKEENGISTDNVEKQSLNEEREELRTPAGVREWRGRARTPLRARRVPIPRPHPLYPCQVKYTPENLLNGSKWDTLSQEIWDLFIKSQQTDDTLKKKMNLWRYLLNNIKTMFPRYGLYVVGSTLSGFGLESSDVDLCLYARQLEHLDPRSEALVHLNFIFGFIRAFDPNAELIQAKVPILKFRDVQNGLQVDLNCNNVVGIHNTQLLYHFSKMDWRVRPLVLAAKLWARAHDINDARRCTLSSYSLTLMVINFLQYGVRPGVVPAAGCAGAAGRSRAPLGQLFHDFLCYYAHFPYDKLAVCVRAGRPLPVAECRAARSLKNDPHQWKLLCVEEPYDLTNTARSVYDPDTFEKIVQTFRDSQKRLWAGLRLADAWPVR